MNQCVTFPKAGASAFPSPNRLYVYRFSPSFLLLQILFCTIPSAALLAVSQAHLGGLYFWMMFSLILVRAGLMGRRDELVCLLLGAAPFMSLFRSYAFYNVVLAVFIGVLGYYFFSAPSLCQQTVRRFPFWKGVLIWSCVYYALSLFNTHDYSVNLRLFELTFAIISLLLLARNAQLMGAMLVAMVVSACLVGVAMLPHVGRSSQRLGIIEIDGRVLGNPAQLGLPLALGFLALIFDRGRWLGLEQKPIRRWLMFIPTAGLLALTTSRMSWMVAVAGLLVLFLFGRRQRWKLVAVGLSAVVAVALVLVSPYQGMLKKGYERTFGENRSASNRTSGRSDQWVVSKYAFGQSLSTVVRGYGPGTGAQVYANYSREIRGVKYSVGKKIVLHSLFMQVMVEAGLIGLFILSSWLLVVGFGLLARCRHATSIFPLACFVGYLVTAITVSGNDINSGIYLGLALLGTTRSTGQS